MNIRYKNNFAQVYVLVSKIEITNPRMFQPHGHCLQTIEVVQHTRALAMANVAQRVEYILKFHGWI